MRQITSCMAGAIALAFLIVCCAYSQTLNIWPGVAPGSENWTQREKKVDNTPIGTVVFNVVTPTLTAWNFCMDKEEIAYLKSRAEPAALARGFDGFSDAGSGMISCRGKPALETSSRICGVRKLRGQSCPTGPAGGQTIPTAIDKETCICHSVKAVRTVAANPHKPAFGQETT